MSDQTVEEYLNTQLEVLIRDLDEHGRQKMEKFLKEAEQTKRELRKAVLSDS